MNKGLLDSLTNLLNRLHHVPQENILQHLDEAFHLASTMKPDDAAPLDSAVLGLLGNRRGSEKLLECVSLEGLEALAGRALTRLAAADGLPSLDLRRTAWDLLGVLSRSGLRCRIVASGATESWAACILALVDASHFTFGELWAQRVAVYSGRVLVPFAGTARSADRNLASGRRPSGIWWHAAFWR